MFINQFILRKVVISDIYNPDRKKRKCSGQWQGEFSEKAIQPEFLLRADLEIDLVQ